MISMENISFQYENREEGVKEINLTIGDGECVVFTGPSGGGKTTLTRLINGLAPAYYPGTLQGRVLLDGEALSGLPMWEVGKRVGSVFQDPNSQFFSSELAGEVAFACENYGMSKEEIRKRTDEAIASFELDGLRSRALDVLSSGEKQRVAIASVYALRPYVYVCDEPTANLDGEGAARLAAILHRLKTEGNTIIVAEHRLSWLRDIADRFVYIRGGRVLWQKSASEMAHMTEKERAEYGLRAFAEPGEENLPPPENVPFAALRVHHLALRKKRADIFRDVSFAAHAGQITAVCGQNGAGKTSLALVLTGLWRESSGSIAISGQKASAKERRKHIWYGSNDTGTQFFTGSVAAEVLLGGNRSTETLERARSLLKRLGLYGYRDEHPAALSGGQKQRLSIACGILSQRPILIFDEPTSGLDGGNMRVIAQVLRESAAEGKTILIITHDRELTRACCDCAIRVPVAFPAI